MDWKGISHRKNIFDLSWKMLEPTNYETDYSPDSEEHLAADIDLMSPYTNTFPVVLLQKTYSKPW